MAAQDLFDLAPHGFDGIEVRRIWRQIEQLGAGSLEGFPDSLDFVRGQIIQNHCLVRAQGGREPLGPTRGGKMVSFCQRHMKLEIRTP